MYEYTVIFTWFSLTYLLTSLLTYSLTCTQCIQLTLSITDVLGMYCEGIFNGPSWVNIGWVGNADDDDDDDGVVWRWRRGRTVSSVVKFHTIQFAPPKLHCIYIPTTLPLIYINLYICAVYIVWLDSFLH